MAAHHDHDVVVIGSGFGGSVAALRLAEKGYRVHVYEAGRRFEDEDFAKTSWDLRRYLWAPHLGLFGIQRIHRLPHCLILAGAGVGGGSLNYANTLYVPPKPFYEDRQWAHITDWQAELAPHYATAQRMLGVVTNPCEGPVEQLMRDTARELGVEHTFAKTPVGVFFGEPGTRVRDPYFDGEGPDRTGCTECGNCMVGCRVGAKNTLVKNYLALAERRGVTIEPLRTVTAIRPLDPSNPEEGYAVTTARSGAWVRRDERTVTASQVVVAAGAWGTAQLLQAMKATHLPRISNRLGDVTRTNSEALGGAMTNRVPEGVDLTKGVAITSSFHIDENTHLENVRYGPGSNAMGALSVLQVDGGGPAPRPLKFLGEALRHPVSFVRALSVRRWSERSVIALVMQTHDNSISVSRKRGLLGWKLTSSEGHGESTPTYIPQGNAAVRALARRLGEVTGRKVVAGSSIGEIFDVPMTAHFLGGAVISDSPDTGVVDPYHRVWAYPGLHVVDGAAVSANLGVNPSLTITAQAERAVAMWPSRGEQDERPAQGEPYRAVPARASSAQGRQSGPAA